MTEEQKKLLLTKMQNSTVSSGYGRSFSYHKIYYILLNSNLEDFNPDFTNDLDKKLVNTIFSKMILTLFSEKTLDTEYIHNRFFCLSEFKYRSNKLLSHVSHFITLDMIPYFIDRFIYLKISVADKLRYYKFDGKNFFEIKSKEYSDKLEVFGGNNTTAIKFLNLTEME